MSTFVSNLVAETKQDLARFQAQLTKMVREDADGHKLFIGPTTPVGGGPYDVWHCTAGKIPAYEPAPEGVCPGFMWIGQPFSSCDRCGHPFWDHTHEEVPNGGPFGERWIRRYLPASQRAATRERYFASFQEAK